MPRQRYVTTIDAPRETVWDVMLQKPTYEQWTAPFNAAGSTYEGGWAEGDEIRFLGPDPATGKVGGMYSTIRENRRPEKVAIEHLGMIMDGVVDTTSDEVKKWAPAFEIYSFRDVGGKTEVTAELDMGGEYADFMDETWPQALAKLKALAEAKK